MPRQARFRPRRLAALAALVAAAAVPLGLAACGGSSESEEGGKGITLRVFGPSSLDQLAPQQPPEAQRRIQREVFDGFLKENPDVKAIQWDAQGPQANGPQRLITARLAEQEMDLIACAANPTNGIYVRRNLLRPLDDQLAAFKDRIDPAALGAYTVDGKVYGVPISTMSTSTFFYNADLFDKLGLEPPASYDELKAALPKLRQAGVTPVLHQGANAPLWPMWYFETLAQVEADPIAKTQRNLAGEAKFTDAPDVQAFALIGQWVEDGILSKESLSVDMDGMRSAFANGKSAMYYGGTWEIPWLQENVKDFEWGVFPFPKMPAGANPPRHGGGPDNGICISSQIDSKHLPHAVKFIEYLTRPDVAAKYLEPEKPIAASIKDVAGVDEPYAEELRKTTYPDTIKFLDWIWPTEVTTAYQAAIAGVVGGKLSPEQAAASVQKAFDQLQASEG
jgi:raffinose/stachyose/melibiose transport system substrate-binding protein